MTAGQIHPLRASERPATPWLNGGGVTREVAASPAGAGPADSDWRVSLAEIAADGPFSALPGIDRIFTLVGGAGVVLTVDGVEHRVAAPYRPLAFPGGAATAGRLLDGPATALNVMTRHGGGTTASVGFATAPGDLAAPPGGSLLLVCLAGTAVLVQRAPVGRAAQPVRLDRHDAGLLTADARLVEVDGTTAVVTLART
ncbi:HutD/Ves family protein [Kitasatospora sp. NPDC054939]